MLSILSILLSFCLMFQPTYAQKNTSRPLFNKKENLSLVQQYSKYSMTKAELLSLLEKKYGNSAEDKKVIEQLRAQNFTHLRWTMSYENNQIIMKVTQPEMATLKISELDRLFSAAVINGKLINFKASLNDIAKAMNSEPKTASIFNLLFIERAEAFIWLAIGFVAAIGFITIGAMAASGDEQKMQTTFRRIADSCKADLDAQKTAPSADTENNIQAIKNFGFDLKNPPWYSTSEECLERNRDRYSANFCRTSAEIHACLNKLKPAAAVPAAAPGSAATD